MAATFIPAIAIKHGNSVFLETDLIDYGYATVIPTPGSGAVPDGDYWAVPITEGVVSGFNYVPTQPDSTDAPTAQSFHVFRLVNRFGNDVWYVVGTTTEYIAAAADAECCAESPETLPTTVTALAPTQMMCQFNNATDMEYFGVWGLPTQAEGETLFAYGYFNGSALPAVSSAGYADGDALASALTSLWGATVGGTFAFDDDVLTLTQTDGPGTDVIGINIVAINPSA